MTAPAPTQGEIADFRGMVACMTPAEVQRWWERYQHAHPAYADALREVAARSGITLR